MKRESKGDLELLRAYQRLPVSRQRAYLLEILGESREIERVVEFEEVLSNPAILKEARQLARGAGLALRDFAAALNPFRYSSYFARSERCTVAKLTSLDFGRVTEVAETVVLVKAYKPLEFRHSVVPVDFDVHVLKGRVEIRRGSVVTPLDRTSVATIEGGREVTLRLHAGAWIIYLDHPLARWMRDLSHGK